GDRLTFAHQDYEGGDENAGRATQQKIIVRSNGAEQTFRQSDFPESSCEDMSDPSCLEVNGVYRGLTTGSETINTGSGGSPAASTGTTSTTRVNTKKGEASVVSWIGGGGSWPP
ncbi:MAG: hypothetical protein Q8R78_03985, partial [Candidatus Omnitrophota bacterium]|nr:hypothetical protein [Candidatus Omnitrophota bacterium]